MSDPYTNINNPQLEEEPPFIETKLCEACGHICHHHCGTCPECDCEVQIGEGCMLCLSCGFSACSV